MTKTRQLFLIATATALAGCNSSGGGLSSSRLDQALSLDMLAITAQALEQTLGAPTYKQDYGNGLAGWGYMIDACPIEYSIDNGLVSAVNVKLEGECRPSFGTVPGLADARFAPGTRFADAIGAFKGDWRANCVGNCVVAPTMGYFTFGDEKTRHAQIALQADPASPAMKAAVESWADALRRERNLPGGIAIDPPLYSCGVNGQAAAAEALKDMPVHMISFGYQLSPSIHLPCDEDRSQPVAFYAKGAAQKTVATAPTPAGADPATGEVAPDEGAIVGTWFLADEACESDNGVTYSADGRWGAYGVEGTWTLDGDRLTTFITAQAGETEELVPVRPPRKNVETIRFEGRDRIVSIWTDGSRHRLKRCA